MNIVFRAAAIAALLAIGCVVSPAAAAEQGSRYFAFISYAGGPKIDANEFVIEVSDPATAQRFDDVLHHRVVHKHIAFNAHIVPGRANYNEAWTYHVDPASVRPGSDFSVEVCSSTPEYIEEHLSDVGGSFLPGGEWCPWDMHLSREVLR